MIRVSDHALMRYKQRVRPCSDDEARAAILSHLTALEVADRLATMASCTVKTGEGIRLIVKDGTVLTVYGLDCRFNHPRKAA